MTDIGEPVRRHIGVPRYDPDQAPPEVPAAPTPETAPAPEPISVPERPLVPV